MRKPWPDGLTERLAALAHEIAAKKPSLIVAMPSSSAKAALAAAPTTPVVLALGDPLATGLVTSLARPDGMITGLSNVSTDTGQKAIELLVDALLRFRDHGVDFADAWLAARAARDGQHVASFDRDLDKFRDVKRHEPKA